MTENNLLATIQEQVTNLKTVAQSLEQLEGEIKKLMNEKDSLNAQVNDLKKANDQLSKEISDKNQQIAELQSEIDRLNQDMQQKEMELAQLRTEHAMQEQEAELLRKQFEEMSELYQEGMDAKELLTIYITLLEKVFGAKPHAKILYALHGESDTISREALNKSLGFEPAVVLRAIHELQAAELVEFNEHQNLVTLKKRLYKRQE